MVPMKMPKEDTAVKRGIEKLACCPNPSTGVEQQPHRLPSTANGDAGCMPAVAHERLPRRGGRAADPQKVSSTAAP